LHAITVFKGYVYVRMFEKICDFSDLWAIVCAGSPFVLLSLCVSLLLCGCAVEFYLFPECYYFVG